jgi:hypothetical protein
MLSTLSSFHSSVLWPRVCESYGTMPQTQTHRGSLTPLSLKYGHLKQLHDLVTFILLIFPHANITSGGLSLSRIKIQTNIIALAV